jgi:hypothetical protein
MEGLKDDEDAEITGVRPGTVCVRLHRAHLFVRRKSDYLDEELNDSLCEELEHHMDGCGPCQAFVATLEATIAHCSRSRRIARQLATPPNSGTS